MPTETRINQISFPWSVKDLSEAQEPISKLFQPTSSDNPRFCPGIVPVKVSSKLGHNWQGRPSFGLFSYFWRERTISVRNIAENEMARQVSEVVSRYL